MTLAAWSARIHNDTPFGKTRSLKIAPNSMISKRSEDME